MTSMTTQIPSKPRPGRSLADLNPTLAAEWHPTLNGAVTPETVAAGSKFRAWWDCPQHGAFQAKVGIRSATGSRCRKCTDLSRQAPKPGRSLAEMFPEVAALWDFEANYPITPDHVSGRSNRRMYFRCPKGHPSELAYVSNRTAGNGCKKCSETVFTERAIAKRPLALVRPDLAAVWDFDRNRIGPDEVTISSGLKVWWLCPNGHKAFSMRISLRTAKPGSRCPKCANEKRTKTLKRYTGPEEGQSLGDLLPGVAAAWDPERNVLTPLDVSRGSRKDAFWLCANGHSFKRPVIQAIALKRCPECRCEFPGTTTEAHPPVAA
ncbi:zinc-ribbon domain-containing protein [Arthrobacter sp. A2-55]|uniref:zinc-ribbon domain-containing protein n=1 Tax=Arthrobacter sp. A2-55 TaxID=2897337 RepID=UPI0039774019